MKTKTIDSASLDNQPDLDEALIFSAMHVGVWDEDMTKNFKKRRTLYIDIPSAKEAILEWAESKAPKELRVYKSDLKFGQGYSTGFNEAIKQYKSNLTGSKSKKEGKE